MKIAITGKGGVGKTTIAAILSLMLVDRGETVLALDADPDANLAAALGIPEDERRSIPTVGEQLDVIEERTGAKVGTYGQMFNLNPYVSDLAERFGYKHRRVTLVVLGAAHRGGKGCACPENVFLKSFVDDLVLNKGETLLMDMEAGVEHLGRGTAQNVDALVVVLEPGKRSLDCAREIERMAGEIGLTKLLYVGNKIQGVDDEEYLLRQIAPRTLAVSLPYSESLRLADRDALTPYDALDDGERALYAKLLEAIEASVQ